MLKRFLIRSSNNLIILGIIFMTLGVLGAGILLFPYLKGRAPTRNTVYSETPMDTAQDTQIVPVSSEFSLIIPSININVPIVQDVDGYDYKNYFKALEDGVAHFKGTPLPDIEGNTVIFGHSSGLPWIPGNYKDIFAALEEIDNGDSLSVYYKKKEYQYKVVDKKVVQRDDFSILDETEEKTLTLMTCYPFGFDKERLVIVAKGM